MNEDSIQAAEREPITLKSKHLWRVVDLWETAESEEPDSQRWVIKLMVDDLRALEAALAERDAHIAALTAKQDALKDELIANLKEEIEQRNIAGLRTGVEVARLRLLTEREEGDE
jgi:hypothetical protein